MSRIVEVLAMHEWVKIDFMDLVPNDIFKLFESDGTPVNGGETWIVLEYPEIRADGKNMVNCETIVL